MSALVDYETLDNIAATLALRDPNREAVMTSRVVV